MTDLLTYVNELVNSGNTQHAHASHYLQTLTNSSAINDNQPAKNNHNSLLIGGLVIFGISVLGIGYLWGKKEKKSINE